MLHVFYLMGILTWEGCSGLYFLILTSLWTVVFWSFCSFSTLKWTGRYMEQNINIQSSGVVLPVNSSVISPHAPHQSLQKRPRSLVCQENAWWSTRESFPASQLVGDFLGVFFQKVVCPGFSCLFFPCLLFVTSLSLRFFCFIFTSY